ncbi:MAG: heat-inducible transcription repressor HrcA [Chloroflexi bacterium HGW-Chloroflexi-6]|nr:MAG: heat-inducible transcription repressor HrcA [Chloroflexi bacterium HGW-Chloroflexi-6]
MQELTDRQKKLLVLIVRDYTDTAQPVGSQRLVEQYNLDMSSATIRNEMAALTEMGFLRQPHTSAGRVPSEDGYRYFVTELMHQVELPESTQHTISHQFYQARPEIEQWMVLAASVLSQQSQAISLVTAPHADKARFKHVELISTQGRQVLMVLVTMGGEVSQQILSLAEPVSQEKLSNAATKLNLTYAGRNIDEIATLANRTDALENDIAILVIQDMRRANERITGQLYLDGLTNVLSEPEFNASDDARRALRLLEERSMLHDLLARTILHHGTGGVQVLIGGEGAWEELRQCSVVLARYGAPGAVTGTLGVLGPMRMSYARTIPAVRYVASVLSDLVTDAFVEEKAE